MSNLPIAAQLAAAILGTGLLESDRQHVADVQSEADAMNEEFRALEARKMDQTTSALKHAAVELGPALRAAASASMDKVAIGVLAPVASALSKGLGGAAKAAGRLTPRLGTKGKLLGAAALAGTGYAGYKTLQMGRDYMTEPHSPVYGKGPAVANNVNAYGYPEH